MTNILRQGSEIPMHEQIGEFSKDPIPWILIKNPMDENTELAIIVVHFSRFGASYDEIIETPKNKQVLSYNEFNKLAPGAISEYPVDERTPLKQISYTTKADEAEEYAKKTNDILRVYFPGIPLEN